MNGFSVLAGVAIMVLLTACSGGGGGSDTPPETVAGDRSVAARTVVIATGDADCPNGGVLVETGIDENGNGVLDSSEVDASEKVCHGRDGSDGADGSNGIDGADGANGQNALVNIVDIVAGAVCPAGGIQIDSGLDANGNGVLDGAEVSQGRTVCHGVNGSDGADGINGANGQNALVDIADIAAGAVCPAGGIQIDSGLDANGNGVLDGAEVSQSRTVCHGVNGSDGANGADGSDGLNSLLAFSDEAPGANCPYGGLRIDSGLDSNGNNILESGEVTQTQFVCSFLSGDFGWQTAELIEVSNVGNASSPQIAVDPSSGNAVAVWYQTDGARNNIWSNRYVAGVGWGTAQLIEADNAGHASAPQIAIDPSGNAVAVWYQWDGARNSIWSNRYVAGSGWGTAQLIETDNAGSAYSPQIALDPSGNAVVVWSQSDGTRNNIWANHFVVGIGWGTAQLIESDNAGHAYDSQVAFDPSGNAVAVWSQSDGTRNNIWSNRYVAGSGWGTAQLIESDDAGHAYDPRIAVDPSGNAVAVWYQYDGTRNNIWSNRYVAGSGWGTAQLIETDNAGNASSPQIAVAPSGNAVVVWSQSDGTRSNIWSNRYVAGSGWGSAELIESNDIGSAASPQIAIDASGGGLTVWRQYNGLRLDVWSNRYVAGSGWGTPQLVETDNAGSAATTSPQIVVDGSGNGIAVWAQSDGTRDNIHANRWVAP